MEISTMRSVKKNAERIIGELENIGDSLNKIEEDLMDLMCDSRDDDVIFERLNDMRLKIVDAKNYLRSGKKSDLPGLIYSIDKKISK